MPVSRLRIRLLGGFQAAPDGGQPIGIAARKSRALLAYLAMAPGRPHSRERLMGLLWSDRGEAQARNSLRQSLADLVRALVGIRPPPLVKKQDTLAIAAETTDVDAVEFERLAGSDIPADLDRAIGMYGGDLLEGIDVADAAFQEWLLPERRRLRGLMEAALARRLAQADGQMAVDLAHRLLALDRYREEGHRALMRHHAENGEIGAALRQYESCRTLLKQELDAQPSAETEELHRSIRQQVGPRPRPPGESSARPAQSAGAVKPSLAVLPFRNLSEDPSQLYFSDGITEDILTELSRYRELFVIARNSSFQFRDKPKDAKLIAGELGVAYLVEGSVRKVGGRIRVAVQLIEAESGNNLWAEHYDRDLDDIFAVQDDVVRTIVATLVGRVVASAGVSARNKPAKDWAAYDFFLQGRERFDAHDSWAAMPLFRRAIELDSSFAQAHAWLSMTYTTAFFFTGDKELLHAADKQARLGVSVDNSDAAAHGAMGLVELFMRRHEESGIHFAAAISLHPSNSRIASMYTVWLTFVGRSREALALLEEVLRHDPFVPEWYWEARSGPLLQELRYEEAFQAIQHIKHKLAWNHYLAAAACAYLGWMEEARKQAAEVLRLKPDYTQDWVIAIEPYKNPAQLEHLLAGLRLAGLPGAIAARG